MKLLDGGVLIAFVAGVLIGAQLLSKQRELCEQLGGTYTPDAAPADVCPGGHWRNLLKLSAAT